MRVDPDRYSVIRDMLTPPKIGQNTWEIIRYHTIYQFI
jgi:hypothetical protein